LMGSPTRVYFKIDKIHSASFEGWNTTKKKLKKERGCGL